MCGVCGEIRFDGRPADAHAVARMTDAMAARGPDSDGVFARGPIALGHRRLSIIDLSPRGGQPMIDSDMAVETCASRSSRIPTVSMTLKP